MLAGYFFKSLLSGHNYRSLEMQFLPYLFLCWPYRISLTILFWCVNASLRVHTLMDLRDNCDPKMQAAPSASGTHTGLLDWCSNQKMQWDQKETRKTWDGFPRENKSSLLLFFVRALLITVCDRKGRRWQITFSSLGTLVGNGTVHSQKGTLVEKAWGRWGKMMSSVWDMLILRFLWDV